jgi:hypothetical protein
MKAKEGEIGCSPLRRGPKGNIPELHYKNLCTAFELFVTINQLNGNMRVCSGKKYGPLIYLRSRMVITRERAGADCWSAC